MEKYLYFGCSHCPHEINGILIHALVPVKQAYCNWEKSCDYNKSNFRCHVKSHPQHKQWCDSDCRNRLCDNQNRIQRLVKYLKMIH